MSNTPKITAVAAMAENRVIGKDGTIPWRVRSDAEFWQSYSRNKPVIMGRKTFMDMPESFKSRSKLILVTRDPDFSYPTAQIAHSVEAALNMARALCLKTGDREVIIGGGAEIYRQALPETDEIYLSTIHTDIEDGDAFFPALNASKWQIAESRYFTPAPNDTAGFTLTHYVRN